MKLILVRHGRTNENNSGVLQGHKDTEINEEGLKQAKRVAKRLKNEKIDAIYSSPMTRAIKTAEEINKFHNLKIIKDDLLKERHYKDFEGKSHKDDEYTKLKFQWDNNGEIESIKEIYERVGKFINNIYKLHKNDTVVVVSHGCTIRSMIFEINKTEHNEKNYIGIHNTSVSIIEYNEKDNKVHVLNCIRHLE